MDEPSTTQLILSVVVGLGFATLYDALHAGLRALGDGALHALAEGEGPYSHDAMRALNKEGAILSRLRLGRVLSIAFAIAGGFALGRRQGPGAAMLAASAVGVAYMLVSELASAIARQRANRGALRMLRWLRPLEWVMAPFAAPMALLTRTVESVVPQAEPPPETAARAVEQLIDQGAKEGGLGEEHAALLLNALEFRDTIAREVMVPRHQLVGFDVETELDAVLARIVDTGHSRYPVYRESLDDVVGVLYAKDVFRVLREDREGDHEGDEAAREGSLEKLIRSPVFFAPEGQKIGSLLREMQAHRFHLAAVVDEFGGVAGIVTLEDILEELVGEIADEHDEEDDSFREQAPGHYHADASISLYDLEDRLGEAMPGSDDDEYDSLGGMIIKLLGGVPRPGDELQVGTFDLRVLEADERHVTRVEIRRRSVDVAS